MQENKLKNKKRRTRKGVLIFIKGVLERMVEEKKVWLEERIKKTLKSPSFKVC